MKTRKTLLLAGAFSAALSLIPGAAGAVDTFEKVRNSRTLNVGAREAALPFSFLNERKQTVGYSIELCSRVADALRKELKLSELKINYQKVTAEDRFAKLASGAIDIECGSTTNLKVRQDKVAFSYSIFVSSSRLLARKDSGISRLETLAGKRVGVVRGTTSEMLFSRFQNGGADMKIQVFGGNEDALRSLEAGKIDAFPQQEVQLAGLMGRMRQPGQFAIVGMGLTVEPIALAVRKNDTQLLALVDRTLSGLYQSGEINAIYERWFNTPVLKMPMSVMTRDSFLHPSHEPGVIQVLGLFF